MTGIVDAILVDDAGLDQSAQFKQMMPVLSITSETRDVEAQHGVFETQPMPVSRRWMP